jgi:hypothetical protein
MLSPVPAAEARAPESASGPGLPPGSSTRDSGVVPEASSSRSGGTDPVAGDQ